ncbi:IS607 family transposase, partial [Hydrogenivirga sp. 128-5-R1-1]|uniref:IS607 family transposase n=1 Tax=Hydrogenivirga sp. 128-5-R1-1 TaxID=392423 RepID=UPI0012FB0C1A
MITMEKLLTPKEASKLLGVSTRTIQRWDKQGLIKVIRTPKGRRRIPLSEIKRILSQTINDRRAVIYARVSSQKQNNDGNLERQVERILKYAKEHNYEVIKIFKDTASGINDKRKNFWKMIQFIKENQVPYLIVEFEDRLTRFGIQYIKALLEEYGTQIVIIENKMTKDKTQELVEDLITIITSFTARIYGARSQKFKKVKQL